MWCLRHNFLLRLKNISNTAIIFLLFLLRPTTSIRLCNTMDKILLAFICLISISNMHAVQATATVDTWGQLVNVCAVEEKTATAKWFIFVIQHRTLRFPTVM